MLLMVSQEKIDTAKFQEFNKATCFDLLYHHQADSRIIRHKREIQKCVSFWKLRYQCLQPDTHVYVIKVVKIKFKIVTNI
jgi:hypothetical protein